MNEFRRAPRRRAVETIEVFDSMAEQVVGRVGNLSESGMLLLATRPMTDDALYQLRFRLAGAGAPPRQIEVGAHQLWTEPANVEGQYWCGFRFIALASDDVEHLRRWVEEASGDHV